MGIEIAFGGGLGNLGFRAEQTVISYRAHEELPEASLHGFAAALRNLFEGMAKASSDFLLAPDGCEFYFLLIVRPPTLHLDLAQTVVVPFQRTRRIDLHDQMGAAAAYVACRLADLGTPVWLSPGTRRTPARLDPAEIR